MGCTMGLLLWSIINCQFRLLYLQAHKVNRHKDTDFFSLFFCLWFTVWVILYCLSLSVTVSLVQPTSLSSSFSFCYCRRYSTQGYLAHVDLWLHWKGMCLVLWSFEHRPVTGEIVPCRKKIVDQKLTNKRTLVTGKKTVSSKKMIYGCNDLLQYSYHGYRRGYDKQSL